MSSHRATTSSSAAFVVVATTTSSVSLLLRCRSIMCAMTGFPASGIIILPGKRDDVIRPVITATTFFPLIAIGRDRFLEDLHLPLGALPVPLIGLEGEDLFLHTLGYRAKAVGVRR